MPGPAPKKPDQRRRRNAPAKEWQVAEAVGWQHGEIPEPPDGLMPETLDAWRAWFGAWWASWYGPSDVPALRQLIRRWDEVVRGHLDMEKVLPTLDRYGITPKGRGDLRWMAPKDIDEKLEQDAATGARLRVVDTA